MTKVLRMCRLRTSEVEFREPQRNHRDNRTLKNMSTLGQQKARNSKASYKRYKTLRGVTLHRTESRIESIVTSSLIFGL